MITRMTTIPSPPRISAMVPRFGGVLLVELVVVVVVGEVVVVVVLLVVVVVVVVVVVCCSKTVTENSPLRTLLYVSFTDTWMPYTPTARVVVLVMTPEPSMAKWTVSLRTKLMGFNVHYLPRGACRATKFEKKDGY